MSKRFSGQVSGLILFLCMTMSSALANPSGSRATTHQGVQASSSSSVSSSSGSVGGEELGSIEQDSRRVKASVIGQEIAAHQSDDGQKINDEILNLVGGYVSQLNDLTAMVSAAQAECPSIVGHFTLVSLARRGPQDEIRELMDPLNLVLVEKGAFRFTNSRTGAASIESINEDFYLPADSVITQEQVDQIAGEGTAARVIREVGSQAQDIIFVDPKKPMGSWSFEEWNTNYINPWNERIAALWSRAYPGQPKPVMEWPEAMELRYAGTKPVPPEQQETVQVNGSPVRLTGLQTRHSGTDSQDPVVIARFVESGRKYDLGPSAGGALEANERGIRNLNGHMWTWTKTQFASGRHWAVGGSWNDSSSYCESECGSRPTVTWYTDRDVGARPVIRYR